MSNAHDLLTFDKSSGEGERVIPSKDILRPPHSVIPISTSVREDDRRRRQQEVK